MMNKLRAFLSSVLIAMAIMLTSPTAWCATTNVATGDIGDHGTWMTEHNVAEFTSRMTNDINAFQSTFQNQLVANFVPVEARVGLSFMNAMTRIGQILNSSLVRFMNIFLIVAYLFWIIFESYTMMTTKMNYRETVINILKKGIMISVWLMILHLGPARIFMLIMGPIVSVGTYMSDMILNSVANAAGASIPDTCGAIRAYTATHTAPDMLISAESAANIMCIPTRLSGFFYTGVAAGWRWFTAGIGRSAFTSAIGIGFVALFVYNIWKFALMAFGVIADLFLAIFMLPFTAVAETLPTTSYKGIAGNIYNGFMSLFSTQKLDTVITRFVNAALYFVSMSIVVGLCAAIMSAFVSTNLAADVPTIENAGFVATLLAGLLVAHLVRKSEEIVSSLGGKIDNSFGKRVQGDLQKLWSDTKGIYKQVLGALKK